MLSPKEKIIAVFRNNVQGKKEETDAENPCHDGRGGHWLERQMGIAANNHNAPDILGYEMKNDTTSKTSFGDWSPDIAVFKKPKLMTREEFLFVFGKPNPEKDNRYSWSGEPVPKINQFNKQTILTTIIYVIAIVVAIIVTYIFNKLFSEKNIRIERKKLIDELSIKVTYLRRIAFHIRGLYEIWKINGKNIKTIIEKNYPNLTYHEFRNNLNYDQFEKINEDISDIIGQSYLALKGLENNEESINFFSEFNPKNYSLQEIINFREFTSSFWYLLDKTDEHVINFNKENKHWLNFIEDLYFKILKRKIDKVNFRNDIKELFAYFENEIYDKFYYLTELNKKRIPFILELSMTNLFNYIIILMCSLFFLITNYSLDFEFRITIILVSLFFSNTIDLILIIYVSLNKELEINEILKF